MTKKMNKTEMVRVNGKEIPLKGYLAFMYNEKNIGRCELCPENIGDTRRLPCGQQNCWVRCHIEQRERSNI